MDLISESVDPVCTHRELDITKDGEKRQVGRFPSFFPIRDLVAQLKVLPHVDPAIQSFCDITDEEMCSFHVVLFPLESRTCNTIPRSSRREFDDLLSRDSKHRSIFKFKKFFQVSQYHFLNWRDARGPECTGHLLDFVERVMQKQYRKPIVVHCR